MFVHLFLLVLLCGIVCQGLASDGRLNELESVILAQYKEHETLTRRAGELERKVADLKSKRSMDNLKENRLQKDAAGNVDVYQRELSYPRGTEHVAKRQSNPSVAFHAYMIRNKCVSNDNRFSFDVVSLDVGGGLTRDTSTFDVPAAGKYVLTWTVAVPATQSKVVTELMLNGLTILGVLISDPDSNSHGVASGIHPATGFAVVQLQASDHVYVQVKTAGACVGGGNILGNDNIARTTFSGWRLLDLA